MSSLRAGSREIACGNVFITATNLDKPDAETRKSIRSHVMRGKNTRADRRARNLVRVAEPDGVVKSDRSDRSYAANGGWVLRAPSKVASELTSLIAGSNDVNHIPLDLIHKALTVVKPISFTTETDLIDGSHNDMFCSGNIAQHAAMLHAVAFMAQAFYDATNRVSCSTTARFHLAKTLHLLQRSINDSREASTTATMLVVISLATAAMLLGDLESAAKHMDGLQRMIGLRGGMQSLDQASLVVQKAQKIDLGLAMATGSPLRLFPREVTWKPQIACSSRTARYPELALVQPQPDPCLLNIWADVREFTRSANEATETGKKMPAAMFALLGTSVIHRLVSLRFNPISLHELLRLSMVAYVKRLLIRIEGIGKNFVYLAHGLKTALLAQEYPPTAKQAPLLLWTMTVTSISIFEDFDREWLREKLVQTASACQVQTWTDAKAVLKRFLWTHLVYDKPGKLLYDTWLHPMNGAAAVNTPASI